MHFIIVYQNPVKHSKLVKIKVSSDFLLCFTWCRPRLDWHSTPIADDQKVNGSKQFRYQSK
jgi:hypothetical protein